MEGTQDFLLLELARQIGFDVKGVEKIDRLRRELGRLRTKSRMGDLSRVERERLELLSPLREAAEALSGAGIYDVSGEVQELTPAEFPGRYGGAMAPEYTRATINNINNTTNYGTAYMGPNHMRSVLPNRYRVAAGGMERSLVE